MLRLVVVLSVSALTGSVFAIIVAWTNHVKGGLRRHDRTWPPHPGGA
jgi:hypothetical protein